MNPSPLARAAQALLHAAGSAAPDAHMRAAAQEFLAAVSRASPAEAQHAPAMIAPGIEAPDPGRAAFVALVCGALVEQGLPAAAIAEPLAKRLHYVMHSAATLMSAALQQIPAGWDPEDPKTHEYVRARLGPSMPRETADWEALDMLWRPAIAIFSVDPAARAAARPLREHAAWLAPYHEAGHWLQQMLAVLHEEPVLALEPATGLGMSGRISGVADNFQLQTLLMDVFPDSAGRPGRRVSPAVAALTRGNGPQQSNDLLTGAWNMYDWRALRPDGSLPPTGNQLSTDFWIWNEGTPEDIPGLHGYRVVLLGPSSYPRSWKAMRLFSSLRADLRIERALSREEVSSWLRAIATSPR